jgi:aspartate-semialdehyde dehydrogenase
MGANAVAPGRTRVNVAVLGATGAVGQTFVRLLDGHPWFEVTEVAASDRSAGRTYREAARWLEGDMPAAVAELEVRPCDPSRVTAPVIFSALDASVAGDVEGAFARAGRVVLSNARNFRMDPSVPLVIPEVNGDHLGVLGAQRTAHGWPGAIVTNANCAATVVAMALAPLHERYVVRDLFVTTLQAVSGAGYPGVPSLDILGNVIPYIADEEPKLEREMRKLLGRFDGASLHDAPFTVSAHCNRVPVEHGHTACMSVRFDRAPTVDEALETLRAWRGHPETRGLPSAPERPLIVTDAADRPQPRRDAMSGQGMSVVVGRVRADPVVHLKLVALGHNTIRGAAGGSVLNAELLHARGELVALTPRA